MKKILALILTLGLLSFTANPPDKLLKVEMTLGEWTVHFQRLENIRAYIDQSNLPHKDVKAIEGSIDSLLTAVSKQLTPQIQDTIKRKK